MCDIMNSWLFHFWGKDKAEDKQMLIFESIARNGLLLTVPDDNQRDLYWYFGQDENKWWLNYDQLPRVCFTSEANGEVQDRFGQFGIAIKVETALQWGMAPVWYLPNHPEEDTQHGKFGEFCSRIVELIEDLNRLKGKGTQADIGDLDRKIAALGFAVSHFKGMSSRRQEDRAYLIEKEWRLVVGFSYGKGEQDLFRELGREEKERLPTGRYFFNGLSPEDNPENTVAHSIVQVQVPSCNLQKCVEEFIANNNDLFGKSIEVVPSNVRKS